MSFDTLEEKVQSFENPVEMLRSREVGAVSFPSVPDEFSNWRDEQRSWRESCALADQSYHMTDLEISGPEAINALSHVGVNTFQGFEPGKAKQLVVCSPDGYMIGDGILFYLDDEKLMLVGGPAAPNWVEYIIETGDWDAEIDRLGYSRFDQVAGADPNPSHFRYQIQGPNALDLMEEVTPEPLPDIPFFHFDEVMIAGTPVQALRHGMAGEQGFELWGPYKNRDLVRDEFLAVGKQYGLRQLGRKSYQSTPVVVGWMPLPLPAVFGDDTQKYREWLSPDSYEGIASLGGSFQSKEIADYYLSPMEIGYERLIKFDHDFVGREAIEQQMDEPHRIFVTLEWDPKGVTEIFGSLFENDDPLRYMDFPAPRSAAIQYDEVRANGELIGFSKWMGYTFNERAFLSLASVDDEYSEPGTEVTVVWGEKGGPRNSKIEKHKQTVITATVAPVPYVSDRR